MSDGNGKEQFYLSRYNQLWNNINRHILTVWQSIAALAASLSLLVFAIKGQINHDIAVTIILIVGGWFLALVYDAQAWFDRNMALIEDTEIFFESNPGELHKFSRKNGYKLIRHLKIQRDLAVIIIIGVICYHLAHFHWNGIISLLPYAALIAVFIYILIQRKRWHIDKDNAYS